MSCEQLVKSFFSAASADGRIAPTHISVYMALVNCWILSSCENPFQVTRKKIMKGARIRGLATYHKCIRELKEYGYIRYEPSYHPSKGSKVCLVPIG